MYEIAIVDLWVGTDEAGNVRHKRVEILEPVLPQVFMDSVAVWLHLLNSVGVQHYHIKSNLRGIVNYPL